jgi:yeast amino acid transporter
MYPVAGGFYTYSTRFISPSWGFAMGWNYVFQWAIVLPLELVVAAITVGYWNPDLEPAIWVTVFWVAIVLINVFGVLGFAEEEFWSSVIKLAAIITFMIIALILGESLLSIVDQKAFADFMSSPRWWAKQRSLQ